MLRASKMADPGFVSNLDARLNTGELIVADDLSEREAITDELVNFQRHVTRSSA